MPDSTEKYKFIYAEDFFCEENEVCVRKYMCHPLSQLGDKMGYFIRVNKLKVYDKIISDFTFDELKEIYKKQGKDINDLCADLCADLNKLEIKKEGKRGLAYSALCAQITTQETEIKQRICADLSDFFKDCPKDVDWKLFDEEESNAPFYLDWVNSYGLYIYTPNTPISEYLNRLFNRRNASKMYDLIEETKSRVARKLSGIIKKESITFDTKETMNLFTENSLIFKMSELPLDVPLKNRGEGTRLLIKNAVFRLLAESQSNDKDKILFAFEEPETHLHPSAQIEMYKTIKKLSENPNYQVIITTHSPYIVKELENDNIYPIVVKRNEENNESIIIGLNNERVLPYSSMNELNYVAFDYASEEFHQELYGKIEIDWFGESNGCRIGDIINSLNKCDFKPSNRQIEFKGILSEIIDQFNHDNNSTLDLLKNNFISPDKDPQDYTLCHCVRNAIDHPCEGNNVWKQNRIVELSIKILLEVNNFLVDIEKEFKNIAEETEKLDDFGGKVDYYVDGEKQSHSTVYWTYHCHYEKLKVFKDEEGKKNVKKYMKAVKDAMEVLKNHSGQNDN